MLYSVLLSLTLASTVRESAAATNNQNLRPEIRYVQGLIQRINTLCSGNSPASECGCDNDPKASLVPPLNAGIFGFAKILSCMPNYCRCPNSDQEIETRPQELLKLIAMCPRGQMESCICASDGRRVNFPFDLQNVFFECRPIQCKCTNEATDKPVTAFGCSSGGIPYCASKTDLWCNGNSVMVTRDAVLHAKLDNACVCQDGRSPLCRSTGQFPRCPSGEEVDHQFGDPGVAFTTCTK